jgi:hypothetical protein
VLASVAVLEQSRTPRESFLRPKQEVVMLVRVELWEESPLLLRELPVRVLRVRHPIPACERMRLTRPAVVIAGASVRTLDFERLVDEAYDLHAAVLQVGQVPWSNLRTWIAKALDQVSRRRAAG